MSSSLLKYNSELYLENFTEKLSKYNVTVAIMRNVHDNYTFMNIGEWSAKILLKSKDYFGTVFYFNIMTSWCEDK